MLRVSGYLAIMRQETRITANTQGIPCLGEAKRTITIEEQARELVGGILLGERDRAERS